MLTRVEAKNYRNLRLEEGVTLGALNIFVGPNGAGKSNFVRILRFLQDALTVTPDERRGVSSLQDAISKFGAGRILDFSLNKPAIVSFSIDVFSSPTSHRKYDLQLTIDENVVTIHKEELSRPENEQSSKKVYYTGTSGTGTVVLEIEGEEVPVDLINVPPDTLIVGKSDATMRMLAESSLEHPESSKLDVDTFPFILGIVPFIVPVRSWSFFDSSRMNLESIRRAKPELGPSDTLLSPSGENLTLVLHNLISNDVDFEERLADAMRELFPQTRRLRVQAIGRIGLLQLEWYLRDTKEPFYLDEMSDGTVRMLCWATVLLSPKPPSLIVLDEPEAGVHPAWLRVLAGWIRAASRNTQVIVSTHSSDLLDYFTDDLESVRVFRPAPDAARCNVVTPLNIEALKPKLEEGWKLGDLYRVGDPDVGGWPW